MSFSNYRTKKRRKTNKTGFPTPKKKKKNLEKEETPKPKSKKSVESKTPNKSPDKAEKVVKKSPKKLGATKQKKMDDFIVKKGSKSSPVGSKRSAAQKTKNYR